MLSLQENRFLASTGPRRTEVCVAQERGLQAGEVRVQIAYVGVCHSDTARVKEGRGPFPFRMGHEASGTVVESAAPSLAVGTRVTAYVGDAYATSIVAEASDLVTLHPSCSLLDAALAEPLACVIGGIDMLDLAQADHVVVVGAGFMGLMAVRYLVAAGHNVVAFEPRETARRLALELGAETSLDPSMASDYIDRGNPVVVEATGAQSGLDLASDLTGIHGTLGLMGYHQSRGGQRTVNMEAWNYRALRVLNLHHRNRADVLRWIDRAQRLSAHGIVRPGQLVDKHVELDELVDVFDPEQGMGGIKTVLDVAGE
jgi:threonine dehydrogenase-like Zn-dependent dehydrogenase